VLEVALFVLLSSSDFCNGGDVSGCFGGGAGCEGDETLTTVVSATGLLTTFLDSFTCSFTKSFLVDEIGKDGGEVLLDAGTFPPFVSGLFSFLLLSIVEGVKTSAKTRSKVTRMPSD